MMCSTNSGINVIIMSRASDVHISVKIKIKPFVLYNIIILLILIIIIIVVFGCSYRSLSPRSFPQPTYELSEIIFFHLSAESLQKALVDKGITVAVFELLREYIGEMTRNEQCVEYGCRALRGILMHP